MQPRPRPRRRTYEPSNRKIFSSRTSACCESPTVLVPHVHIVRRTRSRSRSRTRTPSPPAQPSSIRASRTVRPLVSNGRRRWTKPRARRCVAMRISRRRNKRSCRIGEGYSVQFPRVLCLPRRTPKRRSLRHPLLCFRFFPVYTVLRRPVLVSCPVLSIYISNPRSICETSHPFTRILGLPPCTIFLRGARYRHR
jgi:hypothetical protein